MLIESHGPKAVSGLSHHFPAFPRVGRLMTKSMKRYLLSLNPDAFSEAFVRLFEKNMKCLFWNNNSSENISHEGL